MWEWLKDIVGDIANATLFRAVLVMGLGVGVGLLMSAALGRVLAGRVHVQIEMLARRILLYGAVLVAFVNTLALLGWDLSVLIGAAGILTVALGFASQTSASNLISGLFLIGERPFMIGDVIKVGQTAGEVLSIDLLSVKLRTFDNLFVRVPNELLIKSEIINYTHFPIRRADIMLNINYREDFDRVRTLLMDIARKHPFCMEEPAPQIFFLGFGESAQQLQFSVWAAKENFIDMRNQVQEQIRVAFNTHKIALAFPHRTLLAEHPIPVKIVASGAEPPHDVPKHF